MEGIRKENFLGTDKYIVGDSSVDLVLETLGKVYIKIGRQTKVLSDVLSLLDTATSSTNVADTVIIVSGTTELQNLAYPGDGKLIYDSLLQTLYISYNQGYIAIVDVNSTGDYVRKTGDIMSGPLEITSSGSPLIVASSALVKNLNSQYVDSYSADQIAKKAEDEIISGKWTFSKDLILQGNVRAYGNFVTSRNLSSPTFASGFNGYGWMLNADTNTLTIDNLIVRKTMRVFELVVNKISATNGSIWVSNSSKCSTVSVPKIISQASIDATGLSTNDALLTLLAGGGYFIVDADSNKTTVSKTSELSSSQSINTVSTSFTTYKYMAYVTDPRKLIACSLFNGLSTLYDHNTVNLSQYVNGEYPSGVQELKSYLSIYPLYKSVSNLDETTGLHTYSDTFDLNTNFFTIYDTTTFASTGTGIVGIQPYYKYFAKGDLYIVSTEDDEYPLLKPGDLIRCQKFTGGNMKYYDAIVLNQIDSRIYIIQKSPSVFDQYTEISYNEDGSVSACTLSYNNTQYDKSQTSYNANTGQVEYNGIDYASGDSYVVTETNRNDSSKLADSVEVGDSLIQMGSLQDTSRQNAVYITSSDDQGPYIDIISGLNRPDYSVIYTQPIFDVVSFICTDASRLHGDSSLLGVRKNYYHQTVVPSKDYIEVYNTGKESNYLSGIITCTNTSTAKNTMVVSNTVSTGNIELTNLRINQGATSTDSPDLAIELTYTAPQNHTIQYMISENSDFSDAIWYTVKNNIHFTASSGNGSKKIYVKLKDLETETTLKYYLTPTPTINSAVTQVDNKYQSNYTKTTKVRLGNLDGIFDAALGNKQPYGFGMYGQNVFLTGEFYLNNGQSIIDFAQNGIKEYYKNAGFTIGDLTDSYGNPTGEVGIIMDANRFVWNITKSDGSVISKAMSLFVDSNGNLNLDIQGWIQSNGLYIKNSDGIVTTSISPDGVLSSINVDLTGKITATLGQIGSFSIDGSGLYYGDPTKWITTAYKQDLAYVTPGSVKIQKQKGYFQPGDIANITVGIGDGADPNINPSGSSYCTCAGYFYRQMNSNTDPYYPAVRIISDNVINRDVALELIGGLRLKGGLMEMGRFMNVTDNNSTNVIDLSFGTSIVIKSAVDNFSFFLPTLSQVRAQLGITSSDSFCIPIRIGIEKSSQYGIHLKTQNKASTPVSNAEGGMIVDNNGNEWYGSSDILMEKGDVLRLSLTYTVYSGYYAQVDALKNQ